MIHFVNKLEFNDQKYQSNGSVRDDNYRIKLLFTIEEFVSFVTDRQSMFYMWTIFLRDKFYGVRVPQYQLVYIHDKNHPLNKNLTDLCCDVNYVRWGNQDLEL